MKKENKTITAKEYCEKENITIETLAYRIKKGLEVAIFPDSWTRKKAGRGKKEK